MRRCSGQSEAQAQCLLCVPSGETAGLQDMLEQLSVPERCAEIKEWDCGGAVYLDYLHISNRLQELEVSSPALGGLWLVHIQCLLLSLPLFELQ